jgi:hypothetical protein
MTDKVKVQAITEEPVPSPQPTADEARALLEADKERRCNACLTAIQQTLEQYGCDIEVSVVVSVNGNRPQMVVVAK